MSILKRFPTFYRLCILIVSGPFLLYFKQILSGLILLLCIHFLCKHRKQVRMLSETIVTKWYFSQNYSGLAVITTFSHTTCLKTTWVKIYTTFQDLFISRGIRKSYMMKECPIFTFLNQYTQITQISLEHRKILNSD